MNEKTKKIIDDAILSLEKIKDQYGQIPHLLIMKVESIIDELKSVVN